MSEIPDADLANVRELIENCELRSIECYEILARRHDATKIDGSEERDGQFSVTVQQRSDDESFGVRLVGTANMSIGEATASIAGEYDLLNGCRPSQRTLQLFTNEVGVMTVFPYLREAISTATSRVFGEPLLLPTVERGQITIDVDEA